MEKRRTYIEGIEFICTVVEPSTGYAEFDPRDDDVPVFVSGFWLQQWQTHALLDGIWVCEIHSELGRALHDATFKAIYLRRHLGRAPKGLAALGF